MRHVKSINVVDPHRLNEVNSGVLLWGICYVLDIRKVMAYNSLTVRRVFMWKRCRSRSM